jgi:hypothetical protein
LLFPDSAELKKLRTVARRGVDRARTDELRARIEKNPSNRLYGELVAILAESGDAGSLHATCEEWSVRFPHDAGPFLWLGQSCLQSFYRSLASRDGIEAVAALERAIGLEPKQVRARVLLAELFYRVGATQRARTLLDAVPSEGDDSELQNLRRQGAAARSLGSDVEELLRSAEDNGLLPNAPPTAAVASRGDDGIAAIRDSLAAIAEMEGVEKAAYIRGTRALVKGDIKDGKPSDTDTGSILDTADTSAVAETACDDGAEFFDLFLGHGQAQLDGGGHIDAVVAHAEDRHHFGLRQLAQQAAGHDGLAGGRHRDDARCQRRESLRISLVGAVMHRVEAVERLAEKGMQRGGRQHIGFGQDKTPADHLDTAVQDTCIKNKTRGPSMPPSTGRRRSRGQAAKCVRRARGASDSAILVALAHSDRED